MSPSIQAPPRPREHAALRLAAGLAFAILLALPAIAAEEAPAKAANWTVFLRSGSSIAATEVVHDKNQGRYTLRLANGGYIHLGEGAVRRVSRDTEDRIEKPEPVVASSTGSPRAGAVPGAIDTTNVRPPPIRSVSPTRTADGKKLNDSASDRMRTAQVGLPTEGKQGRRTPKDAANTPRRGAMDQMIKRANSRPTKSRR